MERAQKSARMSGADAGLMGITCYMVRPTARFTCIGISQQWRVPYRWQFAQRSTSVPRTASPKSCGNFGVAIELVLGWLAIADHRCLASTILKFYPLKIYDGDCHGLEPC